MCKLKALNANYEIEIKDPIFTWEEMRHWYEEKNKLVKINKTDKIDYASIIGFKNKDYLETPLADSYPITKTSVIYFKRVPLLDQKNNNYIPHRILFNFRFNKAYEQLYSEYEKTCDNHEEIDLKIKTSVNEYNLIDYDFNRMRFHPINTYIKSHYTHVLINCDKCVDVNQYFFDISNVAIRKKKNDDYIGENYICHRCRGFFPEKHLVKDCPSHKIKEWVKKRQLPHGKLTCNYNLAQSIEDVYTAPFYKSSGVQFSFYHEKCK